MPITYRIHRNEDGSRTVLSRFDGTVPPREVLTWYEELRSDEGFGSDCDQLADFHTAGAPEWSADEMNRVLGLDPFGEGARRAFVGPDDLVFALARMFATYSETSGRGGTIRVFRTLAEAHSWLDLPTDTSI